MWVLTDPWGKEEHSKETLNTWKRINKQKGMWT